MTVRSDHSPTALDGLLSLPAGTRPGPDVAAEVQRALGVPVQFVGDRTWRVVVPEGAVGPARDVLGRVTVERGGRLGWLARGDAAGPAVVALTVVHPPSAVDPAPPSDRAQMNAVVHGMLTDHPPAGFDADSLARMIAENEAARGSALALDARANAPCDP